MKILGKSVSYEFQTFYEEIRARIGIPIQFERGPFKALGDYRFENGVARIRLETNMVRSSFEHNAGHELLHALQISELWPTTARRRGLPDNSPEARVGSELQALVLDLNVEETLKSKGFDAAYANDIRYKNSIKALQTETIPMANTPSWCIWALRYCYLSLTQESSRWGKLSELYVRRAPEIAEKGEELLVLIKKLGWSNIDAALGCMSNIRSSLGLTKEQIIIIDLRTGARS